MTSKEERLAELKAKSSLTDTEFAELVALSPPGTHVRLPNLNVAGLRDLSQALANFQDVGDHARRAYKEGFYVEAIALRSQSLELFLRLYLGAKLYANSSFPATDRRPLGALIDEAERNGFDARVISHLRSFNDDRIKGLHHYLLGATSYASLKDICDRSASLTQEVVKVIADELGQLA